MSAKYPRTAHLPGSPGTSRDDRVLADASRLVGTDVVLSEKLDGSNVALTSTSLFARSHAGPPTHASFSPLKAIHAGLAWRIPPRVTVFGEWCHAVHSLAYPQLAPADELAVLGVRDDGSGRWWGVESTYRLAHELGLATPPLLARRSFATLEELSATCARLTDEPSAYGPIREGVVVRVAGSFAEDDFGICVAKWVRAGFVAGEHWSAGVPARHHRG